MKANPEVDIVVAPSDHLILKETEFLDKIQQSLAFTAKEDVLVNLGISSTRPDKGYGYISFHKNGNDDIHKIDRFLEKPVLEKA